jgi:hypothetical protein
MSLFGIRALPYKLMTPRAARTVLAYSRHSAAWPRMIASVTRPIRALRPAGYNRQSRHSRTPVQRRARSPSSRLIGSR